MNEKPCGHCGHRRDAHEYVLGSECRICSCAEFVEDEDEEGEVPRNTVKGSLEKSRDQIAALNDKIKTLREEMEGCEAIKVAIVRPFIPAPVLGDGRDPDDPLSDTLVIPGTWDCTDDRNPAGTCVYDDENDDCHDTCLFCGHPEERK